MAHHPKPSLLAGFYETAQGTPPADSAAWLSDGVRFHHIGESLDVSSFVETALDDMRSVDRVVTGRPIIRGIKGGNEFPFELYLHGHEDTSIIADGSPTESALATLLENCWGGMHIAPTRTAGSGSTTTNIVMDDTTGILAGDSIGLADSDGIVSYSEVASVTNGTTLVLREALPSAPAENDLLYGAITIYLDEDVLVDSSDGPTTMSWLLEKASNRAGTPQRQRWLARGCATSLTGLTVTRNELTRMAFSTLVGSFLGPGEHSIAPAWSATPTGAAPTAIGPRTRARFVNSGTTTRGGLHLTEFSLDSIFRKIAIPTMTEETSNMPGLYGYGLSSDMVTATATVTPHTEGYWSDFTAGTYKHFGLEKRGTLGVGFRITMGRCTLQATPGHGQLDATTQQTLQLRADVDNLSSTALGTSPIRIVLG